MKNTILNEIKKLKHWLLYLAYIGLFFAELLLESFIASEYTRNISNTNNQVRAMSTVYLIVTLFNILIGATMGLEHFLKEIKKIGKLRINIPKLIFISLPSLYFTPLLLAFTSGNSSLQAFYNWIIKHSFLTSYTLIFVFQYLLGYSVITSFYKEDIQPEMNETEEESSKEEGFLEEEEMEAQNVITYDYGNITSFRKETNSIDNGSKQSEMVHSQERFR